VRPDRLAFETAVVSEQLFPASQMLSEVTGVPVQPNKAIIGRNAFAHEAGIHQDGMLKNPLTYEIMTPQSVGVPDSKLVLGKHSGRHALGLRCEQLGHQFDRFQLDEIYRSFVVLADQIKQVEDHHLLQLIAAMQKGRPAPTEGQARLKPIPHSPASRPDHGRAHSRLLLSMPLSADPSVASLALAAMAEHQGDQEDYLWGV
jgi:isopropylmalate/homocitrate/citramalate synthase